MTDKKTPRLPVEGEYVRTYGRLVAIEDVTPKEIVLDYIFEDTEARLEGRINGKKVKEYGTFNNYHGKDTCVEAAIREAKAQQAWLGESNLEFVVVKITAQVRMRPRRQGDGYDVNFYDRGFRAMKTPDYGSKANLPEDKEEDVWSSVRGFLTQTTE